MRSDLRAVSRARVLEQDAPAGLLVDAINRCCDARGDDVANRAALILECTALPAKEQRELRDHFNDEAGRWARANRGTPP